MPRTFLMFLSYVINNKILKINVQFLVQYIILNVEFSTKMLLFLDIVVFLYYYFKYKIFSKTMIKTVYWMFLTGSNYVTERVVLTENIFSAYE